MPFFKNSNKKVQFLIIGAQKCGTTSLHEYLNFHPTLEGALEKEIYYFSNHYNYSTYDIKWYHAHWKKFGKRNKLYYESTPDYIYLPFCPERIAKYNPDMKFIFMVRDPIKRAYSQYNMLKQINDNPIEREATLKRYFVNMNQETEYTFTRLFSNPNKFPEFNELINEELHLIEQNDAVKLAPGLLRRGLYLEQLNRYYKFFPKERFIIFENRELENDAKKVLNEICAFLEVKLVNWDRYPVNIKHHNRSYKTKISMDILDTLKVFFSKPNELFFEHISKKHEWL